MKLNTDEIIREIIELFSLINDQEYPIKIHMVYSTDDNILPEHSPSIIKFNIR